MKRNIVKLIGSIFLLLNLGLTQIVVGFLHEHAADEKGDITLTDETDSLQEAHPVCKICKLTIYYQLFFVETYRLTFISGITPDLFECTYDFTFIFSSPGTGRAPPVFT